MSRWKVFAIEKTVREFYKNIDAPTKEAAIDIAYNSLKNGGLDEDDWFENGDASCDTYIDWVDRYEDVEEDEEDFDEDLEPTYNDEEDDLDFEDDGSEENRD